MVIGIGWQATDHHVGVDGPLHLVAEITVSALDTLELRPGDRVAAAVKATDIEVYPA